MLVCFSNKIMKRSLFYVIDGLIKLNYKLLKYHVSTLHITLAYYCKFFPTTGMYNFSGLNFIRKSI